VDQDAGTSPEIRTRSGIVRDPAARSRITSRNPVWSGRGTQCHRADGRAPAPAHRRIRLRRPRRGHWTRGPGNFGKLLDQIGAPLPTVTVWLVTVVELFGGLAILVGAFVALASVPLIVSRLVAMFTEQLRYGFSSVNTIGLTPSGPIFGPPGYEINLLYIAALIGDPRGTGRVVGGRVARPAWGGGYEVGSSGGPEARAT
jgi:uncharacterized membrane protein YphA (DoxX/SURF4 family)